jgi:PAS domain S-box-containing protein
VGTDGRILYANPEAASLFGYEADELTGRPVEVLVPDRLRAAHRAHRGGYLAHPTRRPMGSGLDLVGRRKDGTEVPIDVSLSPVEGMAAVIAVARDVSERRRAEERAALLAAIVESSDDAIVSVDTGLRITSWNRAAERLLGRPAATARGARPGEVGLPEEQFRRALAGAPVVRAETLVVRPDGHALHVALTVNPIVVAGQVTGAAAIARDVSDQRAATEALAAAAQRMREGEALARVGTWTWDVAGGSVQWSEGMHEIVGVAPTAFGGTLADHLAVVHPDDRGRLAALLTGAADGRAFELEHRATGPDGAEVWLLTRAEPAGRPSQRQTVRGICQDVTERRRAREALQAALAREREAAEALREADRLKDEFLGAVSHELRTPLTAVLGFATLLRERGGGPAELVEPIVRNAEEMRRMIERLLDFSRLAAGRADLQPGELDLAAEVARTVAGLAGVLASHEVVTAVPDGLGVRADGRALEKVLANLLTNAATFAPPGSPITVEAHRVQDHVWVSVRDEGPGLPGDLEGTVFDRFVRGADQPPGRRGTGIGLAIARRYVELMGGRIWHERPPGGGARFVFSVPATA